MSRIEGFLLAAGLGTRMGTLSRALPKPAWTLGGRSLLQWGAEAFRAEGITHLACNAHLLPHHLRAVASGIEVFEEPRLMGSAGGLLQVRSHGDPVLLTWNADCVGTQIPFRALQEDHLRSGADLTWLLLPHPGGPWSKVWLSPDGRVLPPGATGAGPYLFTGAAAWSPKALTLIPEGPSEVRDLLLRLNHHRGLVAEPFPWREVGTPEALIALAHEWAPDQEGRLPGCYVHPTAEPGPQALARFRHCVLGPGASPPVAIKDQDALWFQEGGNQVRLSLSMPPVPVA